MKVVRIPLSKIEQNENSRVSYKTQDLAELMTSMKKNGLLQPVGVRALPNGNYDAIFGNRRIVSAKKLGWDEIDANVLDIDSDNDRDILNLLENMKRQQTTVAEDGRIFQKLKDSGLTPKEIAARLDVSESRVTTALDVFNNFPEEFRHKIVNRVGAGKSAGKIGAVSAFHINSMRKNHKLNRKQVRDLLHYATQDGVKQSQIAALGPLLAAKMTLQKALGVVDRISSFTLTLQIDGAHAKKMEERFGKSIQEICYQRLEEAKDLKCFRLSTGQSPFLRKPEVVLRTGKNAV